MRHGGRDEDKGQPFQGRKDMQKFLKKKLVPPAPEIAWENLIFIGMMHDLSRDRAIGFNGAGPIPFRSIMMWIEYFGDSSDMEQVELFVEVITALDRIYLDYVHEKQKLSDTQEALDGRFEKPERRTIKRRATVARNSRSSNG